MNDELEVLGTVTQRLESAAIDYMLSGSMALNHYAQPRMTRALDLVVDLNPGDALKIVELFGADFAPDLDEIVGAIRTRRMFNLIHIERVVKVDLVVRKLTPYRLEEFRRRRRVDYAGMAVWIVAPEDLALSKLDWARELGLTDLLAEVRR